MDPDLPDYRQGDRAGPIVIADPYRWWPALGVLVAQPKRRRHTGFLLESGEPDPLTLALTRSRIRPCAQCPPAIHGGFLEHLLTHLPRHGSPVTRVWAVPSAPTANTRPASSVFFHVLNALIRSNSLHGTTVSGSVFRWVSAVFIIRRH